MSVRVSLQPAFILHRRPYRETSLLLEAFTAEHGRVSLVAKGAGRGRGAQRSLLQAFCPLLLSWVGRSELLTLTAVEQAERAAIPVGRGLLSALYLNEILVRLLPRNDPHPALYAAYGAAVTHLREPGREEPVLRTFELRLLKELGYAPLLTHESGGGLPVTAERTYRYALGCGPLASESAGPGGVEVSGATLLALAAEGELPAECLRDAKRLMRYLLGEHLGDRPLETRRLFGRDGGERTPERPSAKTADAIGEP